MIALWVFLAGIVLAFLIASKLLFARALFRTRVLQWAKHRKASVGVEALWVWRIALALVLVSGIGEYLKLGNPFARPVTGIGVYAGIVLLALGLYVWMLAMDARKQYYWYFQVLAPREELPVFSTNGIYGIVRNPRELGLMLVLSGCSLACGMMFTLAFTGLFLFATAYRISSRDRIMMAKHGKAYIDYTRASSRLVPFIY